MKQLRHQESAEKSSENIFSRYVDVLWSFLGVGLGVLLNLIFERVSVSSSGSGRPPTVISSLLIFLVGLFLLGIIIVVISIFMRRRNRDVILLKQRLAQIYLAAVRQSALNPKLQSSAPHE